MPLYRNFEMQEDIDREYDVEAGVPDFTIYADLFVGESHNARERMDCMLDVRFGPTADETLDIFPATDPNAPILVFIHGVIGACSPVKNSALLRWRQSLTATPWS